MLIHRLREGFVKYVVEMVLGSMIYISIFIKTGSAIQNMIEWETKTYRHIDRGDHISLLSLFQNKESRIKRTKSLSGCNVFINCNRMWQSCSPVEQ
jgi:hypothetical protein